MLKRDIDILEDFFVETNAVKERDENGYFISPMDSQSGFLYVTAVNKVHVCLPSALGGRYGNPAGGEHGIRTSCTFEDKYAAAEFVRQLFENFDHLIEFVENGKEGTYVRPGDRPKKARLKITEKPADRNFSYILDRVDIDKLVKKFGRDALIRARKELTVGEFLNTYGGTYQ